MAKRAVLVTTEFRGVFFGYADDTSGDQITLDRARNCIYWASNQGGFGGLASEGPKNGSRIGAVVDKIDLRKITSVSEVTEARWGSIAKIFQPWKGLSRSLPAAAEPLQGSSHFPTPPTSCRW